MLAKTKKMEKEGNKVIHLEIGQPDFATPTHITKAGIDALENGRTRYAPTLGTTDLRRAIAEYVSRTRIIKVSPEMVAVTPSAKTSIYLAMTAILEPGDEVIYPDPSFPTYRNLIEFLGCVPKPVPLLENKNFSFDLNIFQKLISPRTKLVILNSPSNPTGGIIPKEDLKIISELVEKNDCWVISDEIYTRLVYDGIACPSIYSFPGMKDRTMLLDGFSKTYSMTGWRLGYIILPEKYMGAMENLMVNSFACTATFTQDAGVQAFIGPQDAVTTMVQEFEKRRNFIVDAINKIPGVKCQKPQGAFYVFPNIKAQGMTSREVADMVLRKANVALLPGTAFGDYGEGYLRISYASSLETLQEGIEKFSSVMRNI